MASKKNDKEILNESEKNEIITKFWKKFQILVKLIVCENRTIESWTSASNIKLKLPLILVTGPSSFKKYN